MRGGFGLVTSLLPHDDFLIDPLPNLLFTRDSVGLGRATRSTITSLAMPARARETQLTELIYTEHPRFAGTPTLHGWRHEHVEGGDVLLLAPGRARRRRRRADDAGRRRAAGPRRCSPPGLAHTVLAVPIAQERATMHLDTVCTMVDVDKIVMYPNVADSPARRTPSPSPSGDGDATCVLDVAEAEPFLVAAAKAMGIDTLHQIDTGLDPVTAEREQWDDGNNTLAHRAAGGRRLRAQRRDQRPARGRRHRGGPDRRLRARLRPRRPALHVLPDRARAAGLTEVAGSRYRSRWAASRANVGSLSPTRRSSVTGGDMAGPSESEAREFARAYRSFLEWVHSDRFDGRERNEVVALLSDHLGADGLEQSVVARTPCPSSSTSTCRRRSTRGRPSPGGRWPSTASRCLRTTSRSPCSSS